VHHVVRLSSSSVARLNLDSNHFPNLLQGNLAITFGQALEVWNKKRSNIHTKIPPVEAATNLEGLKKGLDAIRGQSKLAGVREQ
jgi:hypothetical protein